MSDRSLVLFVFTHNAMRARRGRRGGELSLASTGLGALQGA